VHDVESVLKEEEEEKNLLSDMANKDSENDELYWYQFNKNNNVFVLIKTEATGKIVCLKHHNLC